MSTSPWYDALPEASPSLEEHWGSPAFAEELRGWVEGLVGPVSELTPVKIRSWAAVFRVVSPAGVFYAKQNSEPQRFEAALVARMAEIAPDLVVSVAGCDAERGLLLTEDLGPTLSADGEVDLDRWSALVRDAAELQRRLAPHATELAALGLSVLTPADAPSYAAARVRQLAALPAGDPRHLDPETAAQLGAGSAQLREWSQQVSEVGLPLTVQHNDLHQHNAAAASRRFFDFADAVISEPLGVLMIPVNALTDALGAGADDPRVWRVADAYLEVWSDLAPMSALRACLPAALALGRLARIESWARVCASMAPAALAEWGPTLPAWTGKLADPAWLVTAPR